VPVVNFVSPVSSSPAVTMLEQNTSGTDEEKAAELKSAILEKAYSGNGPKEDGKDLPAREIWQKRLRLLQEYSSRWRQMSRKMRLPPD
jgi:hypothetical protein